MATITFPSNPVLNQIYSYDGNTWIWDGSSWQLLTNGALNSVVIGNVVPQSGAFTTLSADTFVANYVVTGPINATTVLANSLNADALTGTTLSLSGNVLSPLHVNGSVSATSFTTVGNVVASGDIVSSSNVTAQYFIGDGSLLSNIPSSGSNYSNANVAAYLPTYTGNLQAGNVSILGNILGNGVSVLGRVTASGNITGGNINTAGMVSATGNIAGRFLFGDARYLSNVPTNNYSNANVASYLPTYTGNLNATNYSGNGAGLTGLIAGNIVGTVANAAYATTAATAVSVLGANVVGTVSSASTAALAGAALAVPGSGVSGAVALANVANSALIANEAFSVAAANVVGTVANAAYATTAGTATTAVTVTGNAQPNITSVGILSALSVTGTATTGNVASRNLTLSGSAAVSGNVSAQYFFGNASQLTGLPVLNYSNANVAAYLPTYTGVVGAGSVTASGNIIGANIAATNQVTGLTITAAGNIRGGNVLSTGQISTSGNVAGTYLFGDARHLTNVPQTYSNANVAAYLPDYNGNISLNTLSVIGNSVVANLYVYGDEFATQNITVFGNVDAGNLNTAGSISSLGNVVASFYFGDGRYLTNLPSGNYSNANVAAYLPTYTGNLSGDAVSVNLVNTNSVFTNTVDASAGIVGASVTALGNVVGSNINTSGAISATGNVIGRFLFGDGRYISNIQGNYTNANVAAYLPTYTGALTGSTISVTGNVSGGQILGATLTTTGNIVTGGNLIATGTLTSGAVASGNISATGLISATGNVIGNFFVGNGRFLSGLSTYSNANVAAFLATYSGDMSADNISVSGDVVGNNIYMYGKVFATTIVSAVGNVSGGNLTTPGWVSAQGNIRGTYYFGDGRFLTNVQSNFSNANVAAYLPTYTGNLNPNIISASGNITAPYFFGNGSQLTGIQATEVGVLPSLSVTGNATIGNVSAVGNVTATYFIGDGSQLANLPTGNYSNANVASYLPTYTGVLNPSTVTAAGNITAQYFVGNGSRLTGMYSNANVAAYLPTYTGNVAANNVVAAGNITAQYYVGNGSLLTGIQATEVGVLSSLSVTGNINTGNVNVQGRASVDGNIITPKTVFSGNIVNSGSAQINGNVLAGNVNVIGQISSAGNITAAVGNYFIGNGRFLTGLSSSGSSDANALTGNTLSSNVLYSSLRQVGVLNNLSVSGGVTADNLTTAGNVTAQGISTTGNITGDYIYGNGRQLTGIQATDVGTLPSLSVTGNISIGGYYIGDGGLLSNITVTTTYGNSNVAAYLPTYTGNLAGGNLSVSGNIVGNGLGIRSINAANVQGTVANATYAVTAGSTNSANLAARVTGNAQPNITSVGILSSASISGNVNIGTNLSVVGNIYGNLVGNISANITVPGANTEILFNYNGNAGASSALTFNSATNALSINGTVSASGNISGNNVFATGITSVAGNLIAGNVNTGRIQPVSGALTIGTDSGNLNLQPAGNIVLANTYINSLAMPQQDYDAATKLYVDNLVTTGFSFHQPVSVATTTTLAATTGGSITYTQPNGVGNGIGAYLSTTGSFNLIDTANVQTSGTRILVKNEANAVFNGVYTWSNATTIVRSTDADQYGADSTEALSLNDYFFVQSGNVNKGSAYVVSAPTGTITFGTSSIEFSQFSSSQTYTANTQAGLSLAGTVFNAKVDQNTTAFDSGGNIIVKASANLTTPNIGAATGTSLSVTGSITAAGNVTGTYFVGNGSVLTSVMADRGMDQNNWDTLTQMGVYTVNRVSWSGTQGTPLDSQVYNGILEVKNTTNTGISQVFFPGTVANANSQIQWNRSYWSGTWSPWYYVVNNNNVVDAGDF